MLSTCQSRRCKELFVWMNATLRHQSRLDLGHFGKTGSRMEGHFGTGTTWITLYTSRDLYSWTFVRLPRLWWITLSSRTFNADAHSCEKGSAQGGWTLELSSRYPVVHCHRSCRKQTLKRYFSECCNFELSATFRDVTFVQFTLNSLTCKDRTLDFRHLWHQVHFWHSQDL